MILQDIRYGFRLLWQRPGATLVSMLTMALGIGATTVLFSVVWGVLVKPLPWPDADRLVRITETREGSTRALPNIMTNGTFLSWSEQPTTIDALGGYGTGNATLTQSGEPERLRVAEVTPGTLEMVGGHPLAGSSFNGDPSQDHAVLLSYGLWQERYGGAADAVGRAVQLDGESYTIAGVMPRDFYFPDRETRAWTPMRVPPVVTPGHDGRSISIFSGIAHLKPGVTPRQAAEEATARGRSAPDPGLTAMAMFGSRGAVIVSAEPLLQSITKDVRPALLVFLVAVGLLLATATANVASVQLARATTRRREMAIRSALGAGSRRLARQLLVENVLLGLLGGAVGIAAAFWLNRALPSWLPADFPRATDVALDLRVLGCAVLVSLVASIAFGLLPALQARRLNLVESLTEDSLAPVGGGSRSKTARARMLIMAGQVAVASVLLIGASLLIRSFVALLNADRGYVASNVLTARVPTPAPVYTDARRATIIRGVLERLHHTPGVTEAAFTTILPLSGSEALLAFTLPPADSSGQPISANAAARSVSPGYFAVMGIRLREGRLLGDGDTFTSRPVVVVNRTFAERYFDGRALDRVIPVAFEPDKKAWTVVGVVDDVRTGAVTDPPQAEVYVSYEQRAGIGTTMPTLVMRTAGDPAAFVPQLRAIVREQDPGVALDRVVTMRQRLMGNLAAPRLYAMLLGAFAAFALAIAAVGLFGVLSYMVAQRSREIAVRSALGARPRDIIMMVVGQGLVVCAGGLVAGIAAALWLARSMQAFLYGISAHDVATFVLVPILLLAVSAVACFVPARRAARLDPLKVLKAG
jgi:putative ABC transport system permease protein